jgi:hypothetical protein
VSGFPNSALGFNSPSDLDKGLRNPSPFTITAAINSSLNTGLNNGQVTTIGNNLPVLNTFGPLPVAAIDDTLGLNFQTFMYPFTISFPNLNAFNALAVHQVAIVTLTANFTVQVPTGSQGNPNANPPIPPTTTASRFKPRRISN